MKFDGIFIIGLIPILSLIISGIITRKFKITFLTFFPNIFLLILLYILNKFGAHEEPFKSITSFSLTYFNIITIALALVWSFILLLLTKKEIKAKKNMIINSIIFFILFVVFFILLKIYYTCA